MNIVLVEDDSLDVISFRRAMEKNQIMSPLYVAHSGAEALQMLRDSATVPPNRRVVLLDLHLPGMDGLDLIREMRADETLRRLPVIILTDTDNERDKLAAYNLNVAGYIVKPVTLAAMSEVVASVNRYWSLNELP